MFCFLFTFCWVFSLILCLYHRICRFVHFHGHGFFAFSSGIWLPSICLLVASPISPMPRAIAIVRSLSCSNHDFCVDLMCTPNMNRSTIISIIWGHIHTSFLKKAWAGLFASWLHSVYYLRQDFMPSIGFKYLSWEKN